MLAPYKFPDLTPLGDVKPKVFTPDLDGLIAWLETQDGATEYTYISNDCLLGGFCRKGLRFDGVCWYIEYPHFAAGGEIDREVARTHPRTFRAALSRALSLRSNSGVEK